MACIDSCHPATATAGEAQTLQGEHPEIQQPAWGVEWDTLLAPVGWHRCQPALSPLRQGTETPLHVPSHRAKVIPSQKRPRGEPAS